MEGCKEEGIKESKKFSIFSHHQQHYHRVLFDFGENPILSAGVHEVQSSIKPN